MCEDQAYNLSARGKENGAEKYLKRLWLRSFLN